MNSIHFDNRADRFISIIADDISIIADDISVVVADDFHGFVSSNDIK